MNPVNIARYWSSKMTAEPVTTELQTELLAVIYLRFIRQVGFYLIEMNSGRLRAGADAYRHAFGSELEGPAARVSEDRLKRRVAAEPVSVALVGQVSSGKSSLVNALTGIRQAAVDILPETQDVQRYQMAVGQPPVAMTLLDTPGYGESGATADQARQIRSALREANAVLIVMDAHSPAREADVRTVRDLETSYANQPRLKPPRMVGVLTHVDLLRPTLEWSPPYEWREPTRAKEHSIHDAVEYVRGLFGGSLADLVPVCSDVERKRSWGVLEELVPAMTGVLDDAQSAALLRAFEHELDRDHLKTLLKQIQRSGRQFLQAWIEERLAPAGQESGSGRSNVRGGGTHVEG
jgi:predicted GTPase